MQEADARLNNGTTTTEGTNAINKIRSRAQATTRTTSYTLNEILDEWSREFYFEGRRRMDLIPLANLEATLTIHGNGRVEHTQDVTSLPIRICLPYLLQI